MRRTRLRNYAYNRSVIVHVYVLMSVSVHGGEKEREGEKGEKLG